MIVSLSKIEEAYSLGRKYITLDGQEISLFKAALNGGHIDWLKRFINTATSDYFCCNDKIEAIPEEIMLIVKARIENFLLQFLFTPQDDKKEFLEKDAPFWKYSPFRAYFHSAAIEMNDEKWNKIEAELGSITGSLAVPNVKEAGFIRNIILGRGTGSGIEGWFFEYCNFVKNGRDIELLFLSLRSGDLKTVEALVKAGVDTDIQKLYMNGNYNDNELFDLPEKSIADFQDNLNQIYSPEKLAIYALENLRFNYNILSRKASAKENLELSPTEIKRALRKGVLKMRDRFLKVAKNDIKTLMEYKRENEVVPDKVTLAAHYFSCFLLQREIDKKHPQTSLF